jgi:hypothetical protein
MKRLWGIRHLRYCWHRAALWLLIGPAGGLDLHDRLSLQRLWEGDI